MARVVVIGAGIGGLAAGCYARMNGFDTRIFEAHGVPGGLCTAWKRKGYTVDGCIHWLTGSGPGNPFHRIWRELGAVQGRPMHDREAFSRSTGTDGRVFTMYTDPDRLERHMRELSPEDSAAAAELCGLVRKFASFGFPVEKAPELMGMLDGVKVMASAAAYLADLPLLAGTSLGKYAERFGDPLIRAAIAGVNYDPELPLISLVMTLAPMSVKAAGFPLGGSLEFARAIERRFLGLGGEITCGARVEKVLEENGKVTGVRLAGGETVAADCVISAMDMKTTLSSLLDGSRIDPVHRLLLETTPVMDPCVQVSFGVDMDLSALDGATEAVQLDPPAEIGGTRMEWFNYRSYAFDPSLAPAGKSVVSCFVPAKWEHWDRLSRDRAAYAAEKERLAAFCAAQIGKRIPGFPARIEMTDVATPVTWARYTGNWKGTFMTWKLPADFQKRHRFVPKTVPGLEGMYLASMWTSPPGGVPGAARAARDAVQLICRREGRRFRACEP
jgi:phytoene dehydrogenase-like protein